MKKLLVLHAAIVLLCFPMTLSWGQQTVSEEAMRHRDRGIAAVEMAKSAEDYGAAIKEFEQAVRLAPGWADAYYNLGMVQATADKYADAITNLNQYLRLAPSATEAETVKTLINKLEYKKDQEDKVRHVYDIMISNTTFFNRKKVSQKQLRGFIGSSESCIPWKFRMVAGQMQVSNPWYEDGATSYHPRQHPPIAREWEPVTVTGRFYTYSFSHYMDMSGGFVVRYDNKVKGEIISTDPPRVKETQEYSVTWGAPIEENRRPWNAKDCFAGAVEWVIELNDTNASANATPLPADADINAKDKDGYTPLHKAMFRGQKEEIERLIAKGADINAKDNYGRTPLHLAAFLGLKEVAELLIAKGADINTRENYGRTPLQFAQTVGQKDIADLLRKHGAK